MMNINKSSTAFQFSEVSLPRTVRFWLFLVFDIASIYCSFILLFYLFIEKTLRSQLKNHIIIILLIIGLIIELIDIPFHLSFLHFGVVQPSIPFTCLLWWFIDFGLYNGCTIIMAFGSIHRHLLIFHDRMFLNKNKRLIFHYFPLIFLTLYILIFYVLLVVFPPCMNTYDYTLPVCNDFPCYINHRVLGMWDSIVNSILPTIIITIASINLLFRVYFQKRRLGQANLWRKQRKMAIHLLSQSALYMIANVPLNFFVAARLGGLSDLIGVDAQLYFNFLCYFVIFLFPFLCLSSLSDLRKKMSWKRFLLLQRPQQNAIVRPQQNAIVPPQQNAIVRPQQNAIVPPQQNAIARPQ
jgi:hypothetical protein